MKKIKIEFTLTQEQFYTQFLGGIAKEMSDILLEKQIEEYFLEEGCLSAKVEILDREQ